MKIARSTSWFKMIMVFGIVCSFTLTAMAQDYYPTNIGNTWVFLSADGTERRTYSIGESDNVDDEGIITLKIVTETLGTDAVDTDIYYEGFRLDNDVLAICPNAAATPLLSLDKYNRFTKNC